MPDNPKYLVKLRISELREIKERKENRKITLEEIAQGAGVTYKTAQVHCNDEPRALRISTLEGFARYFDVTVQELFYSTDNDENPENKAALALAV